MRLRIAVCSLALIAQHAEAFPASDVSSPSVVPPASAAPASAASDAADASALAHQLQLVNGYSSSVGPGWTYTPTLTLQEGVNDNVFQSGSDRQWDLITYVTPGLAIYGDTQYLQLRFNYQPTLEYYARNSSLNQLAQQLNAIGDVTLWPEHLYLDVRALAGVGSVSGQTPGPGYGGSLSGQTATGLNGLNKQNSTQFTSLAASPYFLQQFDTYGTLKLGYTLSQSTSSNNAGLVPIPGNSGGSAISQVTNEGLAQFTTGTFLERTTDVVLLDAKTYQGNGASESGKNDTFTNQVTYVLNRGISVFGTIGYENIEYGGANPLSIHDITWQLGTTLTPNPRSTLTLSYGHQQGADSTSVNGYYLLTARTSLNVSYSEQLGTELQSLETQLSQADINNSGTLVNSRTGAPLNSNNNVVGSPSQLYRSTSAQIGSTTQLDRDSISLNGQYVTYTASGAGATGSTTGMTATANWIHALHDDLTLSVSGSYGLRWFADPGGHSTFIAVTGSLQYAISETLSANLSYAFYDVNSTEQGQTMYQDVLLIGLTKRF